MVSDRFTGKVAVVTGGARGQGEGIARFLAAEGCKVVIADVLDQEGEAVAQAIGEAALYVHLDVSDEAQWQAAVAATVERFGRLDILVNNAGILSWTPIEEMSADDYMKVIRVNQLGCWLGMKSVLPAMKAAGGGSIVNTSSLAGLTGFAATSAYASSKFAIRGMSKCAALEFAPYKIRVNSIHPGPIRTAMMGSPDSTLNDAYRSLPIPRAGEVEEVARMVAFLACDDSSYTTGAEFVLDGGMMAGFGGQG